MPDHKAILGWVWDEDGPASVFEKFAQKGGDSLGISRSGAPHRRAAECEHFVCTSRTMRSRCLSNTCGIDCDGATAVRGQRPVDIRLQLPDVTLRKFKAVLLLKRPCSQDDILQ